MAKIIDIRDVPERPMPLIPGLKPPITRDIPREKGNPEEADEFNRLIRQMRREGEKPSDTAPLDPAAQ